MNEDTKSNAVKYDTVYAESDFLDFGHLDFGRLQANWQGGHGFIWDREGERRVVTRKAIGDAIRVLMAIEALRIVGKGVNIMSPYLPWGDAKPIVSTKNVLANPLPEHVHSDPHSRRVNRGSL